MESNSKPGKIHISSSANHYLMEANEGYVTEPRGEILIKGKGKLFWVFTSKTLNTKDFNALPGY